MRKHNKTKKADHEEEESALLPTESVIKMQKDKMRFNKSIKMYLTIFVATTCIYMVLYQYRFSRAALVPPEILKTRQKTSTYASFLWSPISILTTRGGQPEQAQIQQIQQIQTDNTVKSLQTSSAGSLAIINNATTSIPTTGLPLITYPSAPSSASSSSSSSSSSSASSASSASSSTLGRASFGVVGVNSSLIIVNKTVQHNNTHQKAQQQQQHQQHNHHQRPYRHIGANQTTTSTTTASAAAAAAAAAGNANATTTRTTSKRSKKAAIANRKLLTSASSTSAKVKKSFKPISVPPPLYIITPTFRRAEQLAEITRLGYTLKHVSNLLWIVVEDANKTSELVTQTLNRVGVPYEYFLAPMPEEYKVKKAKPRGVSNRNRGLEYLRANATEGVFYFADDDNTYDISIFEQMRYTKKVSMFPVGLVTKFGVSSPIIRNGKIDGYYDGWIGGRKYPVDMAGFAVSVKYLHERPNAKMPFKPGYEEDGFLRSLEPLDRSDIELLANECTEILTWHTQTKKNQPAEKLNMTKYGDTNLVSINKILVRPLPV